MKKLFVTLTMLVALAACDSTDQPTQSVAVPQDEKGAHAYGGILGGLRQSVHHNIYAHLKSRAPKVTWRRHCKVDFRNNVVYNRKINNSYDGASSYMNWVNNYLKAGPATNDKVKHQVFELFDQYDGSLDPRKASDRNATNLSGSFYTNLELYLNELVGENGASQSF